MIALDVGTRSIIAAEFTETVPGAAPAVGASTAVDASTVNTAAPALSADASDASSIAHAAGSGSVTIVRLAYQEHEGAPMRAGGVHDLSAVAAGVRRVREQLGLPVGTPVAMAIAGGLLITRPHTVHLTGPGPWRPADLDAAEDRALLEHGTRDIKFAHPDLVDGDESKTAGRPLLVGLARAGFRCDGRSVGSLIGMEGAGATWTALATWLPLEHVRLKMQAVTEGGFIPETIVVEPLAVSAALFDAAPPPAIYAVIDIGAGTSDLAIFGPNGLLHAASVPTAGDTITAAISQALGLDYAAAERAKRDGSATVRDLWGDEKKFDATAIRTAAEPGVQELINATATALADFECATPLSGIILVGGGSLWPDLPARLAVAANLPPDRVRRRDARTVAGVVDLTGQIKGPAFLTLLGIIRTTNGAFTRRTFHRDGRSSFTLIRRDDPHRDDARRDGSLHHGVEQSSAKFTVADAMRADGDDPLAWFGAPGAARIEGTTIIGGEPGQDPIIFVSDRPAILDTPLADGDRFTVSRGADGASAPAPAPATAPATAPAIAIAANPARVAEPPRTTASSPSTTTAPMHPIPLANTETISWPVTLDGAALTLTDLIPDMNGFPHEDDVFAALHRQVETRGFIQLDGNRVYVGERRRVLSIAPATYVTRDNEPPTLGSTVPLPQPRRLALNIQGAPTMLHDATQTASVNGRRMRAADRVPWDAVISTARGPWRLYEVLAAAPSATNPADPLAASANADSLGPHSRWSAAFLNDQQAPWTAEVKENDRVEFR